MKAEWSGCGRDFARGPVPSAKCGRSWISLLLKPAEIGHSVHLRLAEQETGWAHWAGGFMKEDSGLHRRVGVKRVDQVKGGGYGAVPATGRVGKPMLCAELTEQSRNARQVKSQLATHAHDLLERL